MISRASFTISLPIQIRHSTAEDLENLEWFGMFTAHREIIRSTFEAQERGNSTMLIAELNGLPVGQVWIDYLSQAASSAGFLWAFRMMPGFQRLGIGRRLLDAAEKLLCERGFSFAEITADLDNVDAQRLYVSRGYAPAGTRLDEWDYTTPEGEPVSASAERIILRKRLSAVKINGGAGSS